MWCSEPTKREYRRALREGWPLDLEVYHRALEEYDRAHETEQ
jgi:hypothetical protein